MMVSNFDAFMWVWDFVQYVLRVKLRIVNVTKLDLKFCYGSGNLHICWWGA